MKTLTKNILKCWNCNQEAHLISATPGFEGVLSCFKCEFKNKQIKTFFSLRKYPVVYKTKTKSLLKTKPKQKVHLIFFLAFSFLILFIGLFLVTFLNLEP